MPVNPTQVTLLQILLSSGINTMAKFWNLVIITLTNIGVKSTTTNGLASVNLEVSNDNSLIYPDRIKNLDRATSKSYLMYICGGKNLTHYVGIAKDGT